MVVEGAETRQVTPVPSEQMDYDDVMDDLDRQPVDLEEAIERNQRLIEEEEEVSLVPRFVFAFKRTRFLTPFPSRPSQLALDVVPLENEPSVVPSYVEPRTPPQDEPGTPIDSKAPSRESPEPSIVPAYVEPETPPREDVPSGPPSPGFAPVASFNDLPDPSLPPVTTTFLVPDVPRHLSPPQQSLVSEAPESRARTPPLSKEEEEEDKENIPPTDEELAAAVLAGEEDVPAMGRGSSSRSRSESGSSQGSVDYGLDASNSGDSDDDVVGIVQAKSEGDGEEGAETRVEDAGAEDLPAMEDFDGQEDVRDQDEEEEEDAPPSVALPSTLGSKRNDSENEIVPTSDSAEEDSLPLLIAPYKASEPSPSSARPNPSARPAVPAREEAPPSFPFPSQPEASTSTAPHRPSPLVFDEPEPMNPVVASPPPPSLPMARPSYPSASSRSLSYHVHGSRSSRPGSSYALPPMVWSPSSSSSPSRPSLPVSSSTSNLPSHSSTSNYSMAIPPRSFVPPPAIVSPPSSIPLPSNIPQPSISLPSPIRSSPSSSRTVSLSKQSEPPTSPITRSQCVYHLLRIPGPTRFSETIIFVVPFCSLALVEAIEEEGARILGKASDEDNEARQEIVGEGRVLIPEEMEQK